MLDVLRAGGFNMVILAVLGAVQLWTAIGFARSADPHRLSIVRALTVAVLVASVAGFVSGLIATCQVAGPAPADERAAVLLGGFAESCANLVFGAALVAVSWVLIAVGVRRMPTDAA